MEMAGVVDKDRAERFGDGAIRRLESSTELNTVNNHMMLFMMLKLFSGTQRNAWKSNIFTDLCGSRPPQESLIMVYNSSNKSCYRL